jgi:cell division protein FtsQ
MKGKYDMKKVKHIILWSLIAIYILVVLGFVGERQQRLVCNTVEVHILDSLRSSFIFDKSIRNLLQQKGINLIGKNFAEIDLPYLESVVSSYPPVEKAEVYKTSEGKLVIEVRQRNPILRIIDINNESYYLDDKGYMMKLSCNYTSNVIIANGNIKTGFPVNNKINVLTLEANAKGKRVMLAELFKLAKFISNDRFWNSQIEQIFVNASGDIEVIPRVGAHIIIIGEYNDCEEKFSNLMSFYKNGLSIAGWNTYETINLKYKGQVICTKRE